MVSRDSFGLRRAEGLEAAGPLDRGGLQIEVVDLRTLLPYDGQCVMACAHKCGRIVLLHGETRFGGMQGRLAPVIAERALENLDGLLVLVTAPITPIPSDAVV